MVTLAINQNGMAIQFVDPSLKNQKQIALEAVQNAGNAL